MSDIALVPVFFTQPFLGLTASQKDPGFPAFRIFLPPLPRCFLGCRCRSCDVDAPAGAGLPQSIGLCIVSSVAASHASHLL